MLNEAKMNFLTKNTLVKLINYFFLLCLLNSSNVFANNIEKKFTTNQEYLNNELGISSELTNKTLKFFVEDFKPILVERMNVKNPEVDPTMANLQLLTYIMSIELFKPEYSLISLSFELFPTLDKLTVQFYGYDFQANTKSNKLFLSFEMTKAFYSQLKDPVYLSLFTSNLDIQNLEQVNKLLNIITQLHIKINKAEYNKFINKHEENISTLLINQAIKNKHIELID